MMKASTVAVFLGSRKGRDSRFESLAFLLGERLAEKKITLVYGGGHTGLMGAIADGALGKKGKVIGVIPRSLVELELAHQGLDELHVVKSMHERKAKMESLAQAFIILPGGFGTLDEMFEILTWAQLGFHHKPVILLNDQGYFDHLIRFVEKCVEQQFVSPEHAQLLRIETSIDRLFDA